jgi:hypothetical protein
LQTENIYGKFSPDLAAVSDTIHTILSIFSCTALYIIHNNRLDDQNSIPGKAKDISIFQYVQMSPGALLAVSSIYTRVK